MEKNKSNWNFDKRRLKLHENMDNAVCSFSLGEPGEALFHISWDLRWPHDYESAPFKNSCVYIVVCILITSPPPPHPQVNI